jgi:hypothetical protein
LERGELALIGGIYQLKCRAYVIKDNRGALMNLNRPEDFDEKQAASNK